MPKFFVKSEQIKEKEIIIKGQDVNHIKNVLRAKVGEKIEIGNNEKQENFLCEIIELNKEQIVCNILKKLDSKAESKAQITIIQGIPKADKMELIIQKAVELGAYDIQPIEMQRCVVKLDNKDKIKKQQRWQKIAEVAAKQCGRDRITQIKEIINMKNICQISNNYDILLVSYENEENNKLKQEIEKIKKINKENIKIGIVIGPEGGIDEKEIEIFKENNAEIITLGPRILRTETVALNILSILMYELE